MKIAYTNAYIVLAVLLSLDSLLKVNIGAFYIQLGLFWILLILAHEVARQPLKNKKVSIGFGADGFSFIIFLYFLAHALLADNLTVYLKLLSYALIFFFVYWFIIRSFHKVNWEKVAFAAMIFLLFTGFFQYFLFKLTGIQLLLRGLEESYYHGDAGFDQRMRGFYLEPNWFGLSLYCWAYLYFSSTKYVKRPKKLLLLFLVCLAFYLSGNRLIYVLALLLCVGYFLDALLPRFKWRLVPLLLVAFTTIAYFYISVQFTDLEDRSALARTYTAANALIYFTSLTSFNQFFGVGFSDWGALSNQLGFSWSNPYQDQELTRRDNAEVYVFLVEMGVTVFIIFALDLLRIGNTRARQIDKVFVCSIYLSGLFYPVFQFLMYLIPFMVVRARVYAKPEGGAPNQ